MVKFLVTLPNLEPKKANEHQLWLEDMAGRMSYSLGVQVEIVEVRDTSDRLILKGREVQS